MNSISIEVDNLRPCYVAGNEIKGRVTVTLAEPVRTRGLRLVFEALEHFNIHSG